MGMNIEKTSPDWRLVDPEGLGLRVRGCGKVGGNVEKKIVDNVVFIIYNGIINKRKG